jgi:putative membrane protein
MRLIDFFLKGFAIGSVDVIPGISGGTVALMLGIYEKIINSIFNIEFGIINFILQKREKSLEHFKKLNWKFIIGLILGIITALFIGANLISTLLEKWPNELKSLFLGLILGSIIVPWLQIKKKNFLIYAILLISISLSFLVFSISYATKTNPQLLLIMVAGFLSVSAMILPGISGAFILLLLGMYESTLDAVKNGNFSYLFFFLLGGITGLIILIPILKWLLKKSRDKILIILVGLMLGSSIHLWPWKTDTNSLPIIPDEINLLIISIILIIIGIISSIILRKLPLIIKSLTE